MKKFAVTFLFTAIFAIASVTPATACPMAGGNGMSGKQCALNGMSKEECLKTNKEDATSHHKDKDGKKPSKDTSKGSAKS
jgi:hypothetical protein